MNRTTVTVIIVLLVIFTMVACTEYALEPSTEEIAIIRKYLGVNIEDTELISISIVYNRHEDPVYLLGVSKSGYVIVKRSNHMICESGERNPYDGYMSLKKYYGEPLSYTVYDSSNATNPYYNIVYDIYGPTYSKAQKNK